MIATPSKSIPIFATKPQYLSIKDQIDAAIRDVLDTSFFILGPQLAAFEQEFAAYLGAGYCVGVASGTDAINLALRALGVGAGDDVLTVAHTAVATTVGIELTGARPVFVDVTESTYTVDSAQLERSLTARTRAIVAVHLYGHPFNLDWVRRFAAQRGLFLVEDAAQAHGASYRGQRVGTFGNAATFSFYPTKNLGAYGDGGAVVTTDRAVFDRLRLLREYGWTRERRYVSTTRGFNTRLDEFQSAILRVKLRHLDAWNDRRRALAAIYAAELADLQWLSLPTEAPDARHVYHLYVVRTRHRDDLISHLLTAGVGTQIHYPVPVHRQDAYLDLGYSPGSLPVTERVASEILSLPLYPELADSDVHAVAAAIRAFRPR